MPRRVDPHEAWEPPRRSRREVLLDRLQLVVSLLIVLATVVALVIAFVL